MATKILAQDIASGAVTSPKLDNNISINQTLTVGTDASIGGALGIGTTLNVGTNATIGNNLNVTNDLTVSNSASVAGNLTLLGILQDPTDVLSFLSGIADGFTSVAFDFNTSNLINDLGSRLLRLRNQGSEVFFVDGYGSVFADGDLNTDSGLLSSTSSLKFKDSFATSAIPLADALHTTLPFGRVSILDALNNAGTVTDLDTAYDGGSTITADAGPVSIQRNFAGSSDPMLQIGDGYTTNALQLLADGTILGGNSPFVFKSRESDTISGSAFKLQTVNSLSATADLLRLVNFATDILRIKANGNHDFGSNLAPRFTATPPVTGGDDTAFFFDTNSSNLDDSIVRFDHQGTEVFKFDGYGVMHVGGNHLQVGVRDGYVRFFSDLSQVQFQNSVGEFMTANGANLSISSPLSNLNEIILDGMNDNKISFISGVTDNASAEAFKFDTRNSLTIPGNRLVSWKTSGSEVAFLDGYGNLTVNEATLSSGLLMSTTGLEFQDVLTPSPIPLADALNVSLPMGINSILDGIAHASGVTLDTAYDAYGTPGEGRYIFADSGAVSITIPDSYTNNGLEITKEGYGDGYGLQISSNSQAPSLYIDQVSGPSITFAKDNQNDIGRFQANRPRSLYIGTQVTVGNSITLDTNSITSSGSLIARAPGSNTVPGSETPSFDLRTTGTRTVLSAYSRPILKVRNLNNDVFRVDGYGSVFMGDSSDGYGLDASRIVLNASKHGSLTAPGSNDDAGMYVERGATKNPAKLFWDESDSTWQADIGDGINRGIVPSVKTLTDNSRTVCQDDMALSVNLRDAWARALIGKIKVTTNCPDYDFAIYDDKGFSEAIFVASNLNGNFNTQTAVYYEEQDAYSELHYKITNHASQAYLFDSYFRAEVFFVGTQRVFVETFDNGDFCLPLGPQLFQDSDFSDTVFDLTTGTLLFSENFDSYGVFDAYAGPILASDDMNSLGF